MQPSDEIKNLVLQLYKKEASGELFTFARRLYSRHDGVLVIGTDPNEHFDDYDSITRFYEAESASGLEIEIDDLKAFCEGTVGWAVDRVTAKLPSGIEVPVRHTYIAHKEDDGWKIVHNHISIAVPNDQVDKILTTQSSSGGRT